MFWKLLCFFFLLCFLCFVCFLCCIKRHLHKLHEICLTINYIGAACSGISFFTLLFVKVLKKTCFKRRFKFFKKGFVLQKICGKVAKWKRSVKTKIKNKISYESLLSIIYDGFSTLLLVNLRVPIKFYLLYRKHIQLFAIFSVICQNMKSFGKIAG